MHRSLYSVIPARVRDDKELRPNAKLLYGELSALTMAEGYCWASNAYLAEIFDLSQNTVSQLIKQLSDRGHIISEVERNPETKEVLRRKIWICGPAGTSVPPPPENGGRSPENGGDPPSKNGEENSISLKSTNTPLTPQGGKGQKKHELPEDVKALFRAYVGQDRELAQAMADLIAIRTEKKAINSIRAIKTLLQELERLSGGVREIKLQIIRQSVANSWKSVFPLKGGGYRTQESNEQAPAMIREEEGTYLL